MAGSVPIWKLPLAAKMELWKSAGYTPSKEQLGAHQDDHRLKLVTGGERAGKSMFTAHEVATWLIMGKPGDLVWFVGPSYELARPEMEHLIAGYTANGLIDAETIQTPAQGAWRLKTKNGVVIESKTGSDAVKLAGVAPIGIAIVECAQQDLDTYRRCRGRVMQHRGPLLMSGTFEGSRGWVPELWRRWRIENEDQGKSFKIPSWSNLVVYPGGENDPEILRLKATVPSDIFLERYGAEPCMPSNIVLKEFNPDIHVKSCPFNKDLPVVLGIDPGYSGAYSVNAFQVQNGHVYHIDELYEHGRSGHEMIDMCRTREWWPNVSHGCADVASRQHHSDRSQEEVWTFYGGVTIYSQMIPIQTGITRHRTFLRDPASGEPLLIHDKRCINTINEYSQYVYPKMKEGRSDTELPIDQFNHSLKNIAYFLVLSFGAVDRPNLGSVNISFRRG
jgi:hypothetical protein